jgi:REP element-mobilizing transposase RayT
MLRARLNRSRSPASLRGYCLTVNHVHLLLWTESKVAIANLMQSLAGDFAPLYNIRKHRRGAYRGDRYHATRVEGDAYLRNWMKYIDLNMVRAVAVRHPCE